MAHGNRFINRPSRIVITGRHTRLVFFRQVFWGLVQRGVFHDGQFMLQANLVCNMPEVVPRLLFILQTLPVRKRDRVDDKMAMQMFCIQVRCYHHLKTLSPHPACKLHSNLLRLLRRNLVFLKAQITVIGLYPVRLIVLLLNRDKLLTGGSYITVDTLTEKFLLRFLLVLCVGKDIF